MNAKVRVELDGADSQQTPLRPPVIPSVPLACLPACSEHERRGDYSTSARVANAMACFWAPDGAPPDTHQGGARLPVQRNDHSAKMVVQSCLDVSPGQRPHAAHIGEQHTYHALRASPIRYELWDQDRHGSRSLECVCSYRTSSVASAGPLAAGRAHWGGSGRTGAEQTALVLCHGMECMKCTAI